MTDISIRRAAAVLEVNYMARKVVIKGLLATAGVRSKRATPVLFCPFLEPCLIVEAETLLLIFFCECVIIKEYGLLYFQWESALLIIKS